LDLPQVLLVQQAPQVQQEMKRLEILMTAYHLVVAAESVIHAALELQSLISCRIIGQKSQVFLIVLVLVQVCLYLLVA
jgi:hypothetical protein